ncbi:MAG: hypothetical protein PWP27_2005 [Clostridiales bacterium]|jgi:hypothetical protein|nr:hypothetical protein [Clostridiales bacterium]MDK2934195.1 hypothetical protein [Clostridiales bacterium]
MISITNFYKDITQYFQLRKAIFIPTPYGCKHCCYLGRIHRHGYYQRNAIIRYTVYRIHILRLKCPSCKKTFSVLPSFLIPCYQYTFEVIFLCLYYFYVLNWISNLIMKRSVISRQSTLAFVPESTSICQRQLSYFL